MKNEKIKRNIAGLLALIQLGLVSGCSSKKPQNDNSETLAVIEELQEANAPVEEKVDDLGQQIDAVSLELDGVVETIADLEEPANEVTEDLETSSVEMEETASNVSSISADEENLTEVVDGSVVEFNEDLLKELGIDFNISQDETIQNNIATLNDFLSNFQNVSYSVETDYNAEKGRVENEITFKNSKRNIATVTITKWEDREDLWIYLEPRYAYDEKNYIVPINNNRSFSTVRSFYDADSFSEMWQLGDTFYDFGDYNIYFDSGTYGFDQLNKDVTFYIHNYEEDLEIRIELKLVVDTSERISLGEFVTDPNGTYELEFKVANSDEKKTFKGDITLEDFNNLYDIMHYLRIFDIESGIKGSLIEIVQKYATEEESKPLIEMLNGTYTRKR